MAASTLRRLLGSAEADETAEKSGGDVAELCWVFLLFVCTVGPFRDGADQPHRAAYY